MPLPRFLVVKYKSKMRARFSGAMPSPVSETRTSTRPSRESPQAMPKGGRLRIACGTSRDGRVEVRVSDTGDGIAPENLARIFDLYFTTKKRGSGIGLSLVFRTVQLHNGDIDVESTVGTGTTFVIKLPRARRSICAPAYLLSRAVNHKMLRVSFRSNAKYRHFRQKT